MALSKTELMKLLDGANTVDDLRAVREHCQRSSRFEVATLGEVAELFELDEHTVRQWRLKTPRMPGEPGKWPIDQIVQWRCRWLEQTDLASAMRKQNFELGEIQLASKRLELSRLKASIFTRDDVEHWRDVTLDILQSLNDLPEAIAAALPKNLQEFARAEASRVCRDAMRVTERRLQLSEIGKHDDRQ